MRVLLIALAAVACAAPAASQVASAETEEMTEQEMIAAGYVGHITETDTLVQEVGGCRTHTKKRLAEGPWPLYIDLYAYFQTVRWCYTGNPSVPGQGTITSISRSRKAEVYYLWWDFVGHIGSWSSGGAGSWKAVRGTQGKFKYCPPRVGPCLQTKTPWIEHTVFGNGRYGFESGG